MSPLLHMFPFVNIYSSAANVKVLTGRDVTVYLNIEKASLYSAFKRDEPTAYIFASNGSA